MDQTKIKLYDGDDEIVLSSVFNVYENVLNIESLYGFNFRFIFEENSSNEPNIKSKDVSIISDDKNVTITFSDKIRNTLGSGTSNKIPVVEFENGKKLFFTLYSSVIGDNTPALNVTVTFYLR